LRLKKNPRKSAMSKELWLIAREILIEELMSTGMSESEAEKTITDEQVNDRMADLVSE
jgi:hypothetical protein